MVVDISYWTRVIKRIAYVIIILLGLFLFFKLAVFYMPFLIAFIISLIIEPLIKIMMKKCKFSRKLSSIIIFIIVSSIIIGSLTWGIITLISEATNLMKGFNNYLDKAYTQIQDLIARFDFTKIKFSDELLKILQNSANQVITTFSKWIQNILSSIVNGITSIPTIGIYIVITILALYFICVDKVYILDQIEHHMPKVWVRKLGIHIRELISTLGNYLKAEAILILISFFISLIGFYVLKILKFDIQYPLLIALGIGFVDALPILGSGTVMIPWAICISLDGNLKLGIAIIIIWIIMSITRQFIEPRIVSNKIGIHPIFTLIAMYTGFKFLGVIGMLLGPIILIIFKNIFSKLIEQGVIKTIFDKT